MRCTNFMLSRFNFVARLVLANGNDAVCQLVAERERCIFDMIFGVASEAAELVGGKY